MPCRDRTKAEGEKQGARARRNTYATTHLPALNESRAPRVIENFFAVALAFVPLPPPFSLFARPTIPAFGMSLCQRLAAVTRENESLLRSL